MSEIDSDSDNGKQMDDWISSAKLLLDNIPHRMCTQLFVPLLTMFSVVKYKEISYLGQSVLFEFGKEMKTNVRVVQQNPVVKSL